MSAVLLAYPPETLAKLGPGTELDRIVHTIVFKKEPKGKIPKYSEDAKLIIPAMGHLPMGMGRAQDGDAFYSSDRPYWAGHTGYDVVFTSTTLALAACKAAVYIAQIVDRHNPKPPAKDASE